MIGAKGRCDAWFVGKAMVVIFGLLMGVIIADVKRVVRDARGQ
jgi:hypothetical protein